MKSSMTQSDIQRDDYNACEDSLSEYRRACGLKKTNYKHMKSSMTSTSHTGMIIIHAKIPSDQ